MPRARDISSIPFPIPDQSNGQASATVLQVRAPWLEPPDGAKEFNLAFSVSAVGGGAATALFTLDGSGNVVSPSCAIQFPPNTQARINNVEIAGDTGAVPGAPQLIFSLRQDRAGQSFLPGWEAVGLPGRGGVVTVGFEPFTRITNAGSFLGGFVINNTGGPLYAEMIVTGWYW